jgi:hypothetical protein
MKPNIGHPIPKQWTSSLLPQPKLAGWKGSLTPEKQATRRARANIMDNWKLITAMPVPPWLPVSRSIRTSKSWLPTLYQPSRWLLTTILLDALPPLLQVRDCPSYDPTVSVKPNIEIYHPIYQSPITVGVESLVHWFISVVGVLHTSKSFLCPV